MYGDYSGELMVQIVVLQCIIWYTILLVLFEFRGAKILLKGRFPSNLELITSIKVDSDVTSFDGKDDLETEAKVDENGKIHVKVKKSSTTSSRSESLRIPSNLTNLEIRSNQSSKSVSSFNEIDDATKGGSGYVSSRSSRVPSFRTMGSYDEKKSGGNGSGGKYPKPSMGGTFVLAKEPTPGPEEMMKKKGGGDGGQNNVNLKDYDNYGSNRQELENQSGKNGQEIDIPMLNNAQPKPNAMPPVTVMTKLILIMVSRKLARNPNTYSSILGLVWALISFRWHVEMPEIVANSIKILSDGGLGMAMFSLGLFMAIQPQIIAGGRAMAAGAAVVRFLIGPAITAAASVIVVLKGVLLKIAIVQATLPQGIVPFVFAKEYNVHPDILSTAVIFGLLIALPITIVYYIVLGLIIK